jgi:protein-S-isoprenylcysteine O-methyltransferase Ste14
MISRDRAESLTYASSAIGTLAHFLALRRIWMTLCLLLAADAMAGTLSKYDLTNLQEIMTFVGLVAILFGLTYFLNAVEQLFSQTQLANKRRDNAMFAVYVAGFATVLGFCLFAVHPKNGWFVLAPFFLLYVRRVWQAERQLSQHSPRRWQTIRQFLSLRNDQMDAVDSGGNAHGPTSRRNFRWRVPVPGRLSRHEKWLLRSRRYVPLLMFPLMGIALIRFQWPLGSFEFHQVWEMYCLALSFLGLGIRAVAGNALREKLQRQAGRNLGASLNTSGMYSIVRHPRYLGDFFIGLGVVLVPFAWWLPLVYSVAFYVYYTRVMNVDEKLMRAKAGNHFDRWAAVTPACLPQIRKWRPSEYPFSFRSFLQREHKGILLIIALHASIEWLEHWILEQRILTEAFWILLVATGLAIYVAAKILDRFSPTLSTST